MDGDEALSVLVGGHLDTVSFVMDYVEFRIGYSIFRALAPPRLLKPDGRQASFPEPGSRDLLCTLIDTTVTSANEVRRTGSLVIEIGTDAGDRLCVALADAQALEFAHLVPSDGRGGLMAERMLIWQADSA